MQAVLFRRAEHLCAGRRICQDCEKKIVSVTVDDPAYEIYVEKLKEIWSQAG